MGDIPHGVVSYDLNKGEAKYVPASGGGSNVITLVPGKDDTLESWFKVGGADAMADKLIAEKRMKPCTIVVGKGSGKNVLRADDYKTWTERQKALEELMLKQ
jgi:hypothetical protein